MTENTRKLTCSLEMSKISNKYAKSSQIMTKNIRKLVEIAQKLPKMHKNIRKEVR